MSELPHLKTPSIIVILGATGDLTTRKIIPSLWRLYSENLLPSKCSIVAFSKDNLLKEEYNNYIKKTLVEKSEIFDEEKLQPFLNFFTYISGDFENEKSFQKIATHVENFEEQWKVCSNKIFFMAASPVFYHLIFENLAKVKLNIPCDDNLGWTRILIEKPFGHDLKSSQELQKMLSKYFKEEQIYRIDHYLAKEIIRGITNFRFSNNLFEASWNNKMIEKIEIRLFETKGVEQRGQFYDFFGALRDVGQNHLLELLALITMKFPQGSDLIMMRKRREEILGTLKKWNKKLIKENTYQAQYEGYLDIDGVKKNSNTETFFSLRTEVEDPEWKGVPIIIEAGKKCKEARKEIVVTMKPPTDCFLCEPGEQAYKNQVIFEVEPKNQILIKFLTKQPGFEKKLEERFFSFFLYEKEDKTEYAEEYAKLFYEAMAGSQTDFASKKEVEYLWRFTDPIVSAWRSGVVPLEVYKQGTTPEAVFTENPIKELVFFNKTINVIGLGKMGANLSLRLIENNWNVYGYNIAPEVTKSLEKNGLHGVYSLKEMAEKDKGQRIFWLMVPAGKPVDEVIFGKEGLIKYLQKGDIIIDGGNSFYKDSIERFKKLKKIGIHFIDVGVSGGPNGARNGASLMIGGEKDIFEKLEPLFATLALENSYQFFEGAGAGHFVKMIHNGIEYGMMQAIAEGFAILKKSNYKLDLTNVADIYNHGSVIESRLIGWLEKAFEVYGDNLNNISGTVGYTGEGEWTVKTAKQMNVKAKIIEESLKFRVNSKKNPDYTGKILSAMRNQFGGHAIK